MDERRVKEILEEVQKRTESTAYSLTIQPDREPDIFDSKFGGLPYWDMSREYPADGDGKMLMLLAQINLERMEPDEKLPKTGMLQFFTGRDDVFGSDFNKPDIQDTFRVVYHEKIDYSVSKENIQSIHPPVNTEEDNIEYSPVLKEAAVEIIKKKAYMDDNDYRFEKLFWQIAKEEYGEDLEGNYIYDLMEEEDYNKWMDKFSNQGHSLLGYPYFTQWDPRDGKEEYDYYDTLLFQMDSDYIENEDYVLWGDCGVGNFFINSQDLKKCDFSKVLYNWDCC